MASCEGRDSMNQLCKQTRITGDGRLCYWHEKVASGLIRDYFAGKNSASEFEFTLVQSTPKPGVGA